MNFVTLVFTFLVSATKPGFVHLGPTPPVADIINS